MSRIKTTVALWALAYSVHTRVNALLYTRSYPALNRDSLAETFSSSETACRNVSRCSRMAFRAFSGLRCTSA